jgi:ubiquinone/menaquinone biosynthesis C-methylase UbiE
MSHALILDQYIVNALDASLGSSVNLLDIGVGHGYWGYFTRVVRDFRGYVVGVEISLECLRRIKRTKLYDELVLSDAAFLPFRNNAFDVSLLVEVLEHMSKALGRATLVDVVRITRKKLILTTPNGVWGKTCTIENKQTTDLGHARVHVSVWSKADLEELGVSVRGVGCKLLRLDRPGPLILRYAKKFLDVTLGRLSEHFPWLADFLFREIDIH